MDRFEKTIEVAAPVENVFRVLSDYESYPRWMHNIVSVRQLRDNKTEWRGVAPPGDDTVELGWIAETVTLEPDRRIMWQATEGDVTTDCEVVIQETKEGRTIVRMVRGFEIKGDNQADGNKHSMIEYQRLRLEEDLSRLKQMVESFYQTSSTKTDIHDHAASFEDIEHQQVVLRPNETEKILKRGVDRLLDDPPSKEWRK